MFNETKEENDLKPKLRNRAFTPVCQFTVSFSPVRQNIDAINVSAVSPDKRPASSKIVPTKNENAG